jgi:hypothetical protein
MVVMPYSDFGVKLYGNAIIVNQEIDQRETQLHIKACHT